MRAVNIQLRLIGSLIEKAGYCLEGDDLAVYGEVNSESICPVCDDSYDAYEDRCTHCFTEPLAPARCTSASRHVRFLKGLRDNDLWGCQFMRGPWTLSEVAERITDFQINFAHSCTLSEECPLRIRVRDIANGVRRIVEDLPELKLLEG